MPEKRELTRQEAAKAIRDRAIRQEGCWGWIGSTDRDGYGTVKLHGRHYRAPRLAFFAANGYWPMPLVRHTCDNHICCNPKHLIEGTHKQNSRDARVRGLLVRPPTHDKWNEGRGRAKLSEAQVDEIRELYATGSFTQKELAERFGVWQNTIGRIVRHETWN